MNEVHSRIAPTPSGFLHSGNAYNFLLAEFITLQKNGSLRLRIDDLDALRVRPEYLTDIFETLHWLGISWHNGPEGALAQERIFSQQLRLAFYQNALTQLVSTGSIFACNCSRKDIVLRSDDGQYPGTCISKNIPLDAPDVTWRVYTPESLKIDFTDGMLGSQQVSPYQSNRHFIVRRRDGIPAYHIASLVDDVDYDCNLIVRGVDLLESTAAQLYLADLLGYKSFGQTSFYHHPLIANNNGEKLSKSAGSTSIKHLRESGQSSENFRESFEVWRRTFML